MKRLLHLARFGLGLIFGILLATRLGGQNTISLPELLDRLPGAESPARITDPDAFRDQLLAAFSFGEETIPEAQTVLHQLFSYSAPAGDGEQQALLQQMSDEVIQTLWSHPQRDSLAFKKMEDRIQAILRNSSDEQASFRQQQLAIAQRTARYLLQFYYQNPTATANRAWEEYLKTGTAPSHSLSELLQQAREVTPPPPTRGLDYAWLSNLILALLALMLAGWLWVEKASQKQLRATAERIEQRLTRELREVREQVRDLEEKLEKAQAAAIPPPDPVPPSEEVEETNAGITPPSETATPIAPPQKEAPRDTYFAVAPKNGLFFGRQLSPTFREREHIYRIEILEDDTAYYYLVDDQITRQHAFNIPDNYIRPAMEMDGQGRLSEATAIHSSRGSLKKVGNNWQIEEKAVLTYS